MDEVLGDSIMIAYESDKIMKAIYEVRAGMKDKTYFEHFEELAKELKKLQKRSRIMNVRARRGGGRKTLKRKGDTAKK